MAASHTSLQVLLAFHRQGQAKVDNEQPRRYFRLGFSINDYVPGFVVTVRNVVLMQKSHAFNELKT